MSSVLHRIFFTTDAQLFLRKS